MLVEQFRRQHHDAPAGFAFALAQAAHLEFHPQHVAYFDGQQKIPRPTKRHTGQKAVFALGFEAIGHRLPHQPMRHAAAKMRCAGVGLIHMHRGEIPREFGVGVNAFSGDRVGGADAFIADAGVVPVFFRGFEMDDGGWHGLSLDSGLWMSFTHGDVSMQGFGMSGITALFQRPSCKPPASGLPGLEHRVSDPSPPPRRSQNRFQ